MAWVDQRIMQHLDYYCLHVFEHDDKDTPTIMNAAIGQIFGQERFDRRKEVKAAIDEERCSVDAKFAELEEASNERWVATDHHIESARESVLQSNSEAFRQLRAESREEFKRVVEEKERAVDAKFAVMEQASNDQWAAIDQQIERAPQPEADKFLAAQ